MGATPQSRALAPRGDAAKYKVLYRFGGGSDARVPLAALIDVNGTLYGTTYTGGSTGNHGGTVFSITRGGKEQVVFRFDSQDGRRPEASLINVSGTLYGTTYGGGGRKRGVVFSLTTGGVEQVLHRFDGNHQGSRGGHPRAPLVELGGTFYGTTAVGGRPINKGTVFSITASGKFTEMYRFGEGTDGTYPVAPLIDMGGTLYGTTTSGGTYGLGTVFSITTSGTENVLYSFASGTDGSHPAAGLIDVGDTLYGTTTSGGTHGLGTVFSITTSGTENVLYSFAGYPTDGADPAAGLINVDGTLYGTTENGGSGSACSSGCGTVYAISTNGAETVLHDFTSDPDGALPRGGLLDVTGVLYGTTSHGGISRRGVECPRYGCGTVFALRP
jgi:uncharacterized repeat protein (TIGR03803 family)